MRCRLTIYKCDHKEDMARPSVTVVVSSTKELPSMRLSPLE